MKDIPWFKFWIDKWTGNAALRACDKYEKGVWIDMIVLAYRMPERGVFCTNGTPWTVEQIAFAIGGDKKKNARAILNLISLGVCKKDDRGNYYCSRVVRDEEYRLNAQISGSQGGNPLLKSKGSPKGSPKGRSKGAVKGLFENGLTNRQQTAECSSKEEQQQRENPRVEPPAAAAAPLGFEEKDALARKLILNAECESLTAPDRKIFHEVAQAVLDGKLPESTAIALATKAAKGNRNKAGLFRRLVSEHQE